MIISLKLCLDILVDKKAHNKLLLKLVISMNNISK